MPYYDGLGLVIFRRDVLRLVFVVRQGISVDRSLRHQTVGQRNVEDAGNEASPAEEEKVPVEAGGFLEREVARLSSEGRDIVVVVEEKHHQATDREGDEDPFDGEGPERDDPGSVNCWVERSCDGEAGEVRVRKVSRDMREACPPDCGERIGVFGEEFADGRGCESHLADAVEEEYGEEVQDSDHSTGKAVADLTVFEVDCEFFAAFYNVDCTDIEPERLRREIGDGAHVIAEIRESDGPMPDCGPDTNPDHEAGIEGYVVE